MLIHAVLLRRLDGPTEKFSYFAPDSYQLKPGQLIRVPFGRRTESAIVWERPKAPSAPTPVRELLELVRPEPVMTDWQMRACETIAADAAVHLSRIIASIVPTFPTKPRTRRPLTEDKKRRRIVVPTGPIWWYSNRSSNRKNELAWLQHAGALPRIIIVPTREDGLAYAPAGAGLPIVDSTLTPAAYRQLYLAVLTGEITRCVGTWRALTLPWPRAPEVIVDQEEHPAHKQTGRYPWLDLRPIVARVATRVVWTTPAPSLRLWQKLKPEPPVAADCRAVWSLDRTDINGPFTPELETRLHAADVNAQLLILGSRRGFATAITCRDCGWVLRCPYCHVVVRMASSIGPLLCQQCRSRVTVPDACPRCQAPGLSPRGFGIDRIEQIIKRRWPEIQVSQIIANPRAPVVIATFQGWRAADPDQLRHIVLLHGDALLQVPDFAASERGWQFLFRLAANFPAAEIAVQSHEPQSNFWQRWLSADHRAWYTHELADRKRLGLPPITRQWLAVYRGSGREGAVAAVLRAAARRPVPDLKLESIPWPRLGPAVLLTAKGSCDPWVEIPRTEWFPSPWQLDTHLTSWVS